VQKLPSGLHAPPVLALLVWPPPSPHRPLVQALEQHWSGSVQNVLSAWQELQVPLAVQVFGEQHSDAWPHATPVPLHGTWHVPFVHVPPLQHSSLELQDWPVCAQHVPKPFFISQVAALQHCELTVQLSASG
jgi:hypothetical protein